MLYEYICDSCGCGFERRVPVDDRNKQHCPDCGTLARKKFSVVHNTFGWDWDWQNGKYKGEKNVKRAV